MQQQIDEQIELSLVEVFRKFFALLGLVPTQLKGEEEGLVDLLELTRKKFENSDKSEREVFRWLFRRWQKYFPEEAVWREGYIILRALFVEEMKWSEISYLTGKHVSELRMVALKSLVAQLEFSQFEERPTRDCARNDIYLLDVLSRQTWSDSLALNSSESLERHAAVCPRCMSMLKKSRAWVSEICQESKQDLSPFVIEGLVDGREPVGSIWELLLKGALGVAVMGGVVLSVPHVPNLTKLLSSEIQKVTQKVQDSIVVDDIEKVLDEVAQKEDQGVEYDGDDVVEPAIEMEEETTSPEVIGSVELAGPTESGEQPKFSRNYVLLPEDMKSSEVESVAEADRANAQEEVEAEPQVATSQVFFRWGARAEDPERLKLKVLEILESFSAQNISEFELGSIYKGGQYFHFTMNKNDYAKLLSGIRQLPFTEFTVSEAKGSRKINASKSRIVFWVGPSK